METIAKVSTKDLNNEGLTKSFIQSIDMNLNYSPVQLQKGDEPCHLLKCNAGYWVKDENGGYLKDRKGQLFIVSEKEALIGRARYVLNHQSQIFEEKVQREVRQLEKKITDYLQPVLDKVRQAHIIVGNISSGHTVLLDAFTTLLSEEERQSRMNNAKGICQLMSIEKYEQYKSDIENKNFDDLYIMFIQQGIPELARYSMTDIDSLKECFSSDSINGTLEHLKDKSHLYKIAYLKVKGNG